MYLVCIFLLYLYPWGNGVESSSYELTDVPEGGKKRGGLGQYDM